MTATTDLLSPDTLVGLVDHDTSRDPFPVTGWDAVVWAVGNATQSALYFQLAFGMRLEAYSGPETGNRDHHAYVLRSGTARFVIKGAASPGEPARRPPPAGTATASSTWRSRCPTWTSAWRTPARPGARVVEEPHDLTDSDGTVRIAVIAAYGDTMHTLVDRSRYHGAYLPGYAAHDRRRSHRPTRPSSRSTTWSATWNSARWTSGWSSTTGSWASRTWPSSSATTSPPSTRR